MDMASADLIVAEKAPFADRIQMCSKCCRKLADEGKVLRKAVKASVRDGYGDAVEVEEADCFSLCPKGGQVVVAVSKKQARRLVILEPGSDIGHAVEYLLSDSE